jgi:metallo-beta-lactamase family protein
VHVTFYGAAREVTGSMHLLTTDQDRILLDCGMFQGRRQESDRKNRILPFDPGIITNVILSHAHIDHSGRIPLLTKDKFTGRIICTRATADACGYMLPDSAHIQESDAKYLNYKMVRSLLAELREDSSHQSSGAKKIKAIRKLLKNDKEELNTEAINDVSRKYHLAAISPLYTVEDARHAISFFDGIPYRSPVAVGKNAQCMFYDAGHILGSAISIIRISVNGKSFNVCYTGDIGRFDKPILKNPTLDFDEADRDIDLLIMESTYGDRDHEPVGDMAPLLKQVICQTVDRGGTILIPSFAFGRTQELLYYIHELYHRREVPEIPVYVDSPLATEITRVFSEHPEMYDTQAHRDFLEKGENPFVFDKVRFIQSVEESMGLMRERRPHIVISASGMCEAGRILHHLRYKIHDEKNTILIVGFMAENTLGRRILEKGEKYEASGRTGAPPILKFLNKEYPLKARVVKLGGFSAHGDRKEMLRFIKDSNLRIKKIALVHGEESPIQSFAEMLRGQGFPVVIPKSGESLHLPI